MNLAQFQQATAKLTALPEGQVMRAIAAAKDLSDELKEEMFGELTTLNQRLMDAEIEHDRAITNLENLVLETDREMRSLERTEAESKEQVTGLKVAERKLKRKTS